LAAMGFNHGSTNCGKTLNLTIEWNDVDCKCRRLVGQLSQVSVCQVIKTVFKRLLIYTKVHATISGTIVLIREKTRTNHN
jgi:hypothetical protein